MVVGLPSTGGRAPVVKAAPVAATVRAPAAAPVAAPVQAPAPAAVPAPASAAVPATAAAAVQAPAAAAVQAPAVSKVTDIGAPSALAKRSSRFADPSKMYSGMQVLLMEETDEFNEPSSCSVLNVCCNLFLGACIGATTVLLIIFFFTDCRFESKKNVVKNNTKNKSRAGIEEWDHATQDDLAVTALTVLALEDSNELTRDGEQSSPGASSSTPNEPVVTNSARKQKSIKKAAK
ncbi:hypothetical protein MTO96_003185 [Rhipicephalus appendiculatus]